jgi:hypothetical protein
MTSHYLEFGFGAGDEKLTAGKFERFKAKENETYRVSFVWWPEDASGKPNLDAATPNFTAAKRFYIPNVGYVLDKGPEFARLAGTASKLTVATVIAIWPTTRKGELDKDRFIRGDVEVKPWVFSVQLYEQLSRRHQEFPFGQYDLSIACTDTQFQKMDLTPCRENLYRKALENAKLASLVDSIKSSTSGILEGIQGLIARDMTIDQIREKRGDAAPAGLAASSATTAEVDSLIDDIIGD